MLRKSTRNKRTTRHKYINKRSEKESKTLGFLKEDSKGYSTDQLANKRNVTYLFKFLNR
jgi:hypothetical protein